MPLCGAVAARSDDAEPDWKERPVAKVIAILEDMSAELEKEADAAEEAYEKIQCYSEANDNEKTKFIAAAELKSVLCSGSKAPSCASIGFMPRRRTSRWTVGKPLYSPKINKHTHPFCLAVLSVFFAVVSGATQMMRGFR